jgi:hypothetical protein
MAEMAVLYVFHNLGDSRTFRIPSELHFFPYPRQSFRDNRINSLSGILDIVHSNNPGPSVLSWHQLSHYTQMDVHSNQWDAGVGDYPDPFVSLFFDSFDGLPNHS